MTVLLPVAPRISLVDKDGRITRPWQLYFDAVFARIGGSMAPDVPDLEIGNLPMLDESIGARLSIVESYQSHAPQVQHFVFEASQDAQLSALQAEVAALRGLVEGLLQART
jgi:hypothetical protein